MKHSPRSHAEQQKRLLFRFLGGSLCVILISVSVSATFLARGFSDRERERAQISIDQLQHFFSFHYGRIVEEMWTQSFASIASRVALIAREWGNASYEVIVADENGYCVYCEKTGGSGKCILPPELRALIRNPEKDSAPKLTFDSNRQSYLYLTPIQSGTLVKGFLFASIADPYQFYRGPLIRILGTTLLPCIAFIALIWGLWLWTAKKLFLKPYLKKLEEAKVNERFADLARQTAHDIRDPLSVIDRSLSGVDIPPATARMLNSSVLQLKEIAADLLEQGRVWATGENNASSTHPTLELLSELLELTVLEKRVQFANHGHLTIDIAPESNPFGVFVSVDRTDFRRVLSNLINNAVEACNGNGAVKVSVKLVAQRVRISIEDQGPGFCPQAMLHAGTRGASFGKRNGNGLGLHFAKTTLENWGGSLEIESSLEIGTRVSIFLPKHDAPPWFLTKLRVLSGQKIVILDDSEEAHGAWSQRFENRYEVSSFQKSEEFLRAQCNFEAPLYLIDYQLGTEARTGLDLIDELEIGSSSVLVTNHYLESDLQKTCQKMGIKILPKGLISRVPIEKSDATGSGSRV